MFYVCHFAALDLVGALPGVIEDPALQTKINKSNEQIPVALALGALVGARDALAGLVAPAYN